MNTISATTIGNTIITCYRNINSKQGAECTLLDFLTRVSDRCHNLITTLRNISDEDEQKQYKTHNIPCATITIVAGEDKSIEHCKHKNNLLVIDIDAHDNPQLYNEIVLENMGYNLFNLPYVYAVGRSCRGKGLFVIIPIQDVENIKSHFESIKAEFETRKIIIDKQCSNINRLRFVSWDENLINGTWIKEGEVEIYDRLSEQETREKKEKGKGETAILTSFRKPETVIPAGSLLLNNVFIMKSVMLLVSKCEYRSDDYYSWLQDGFRLATLEEELGCILFILISRRSNGYKNDSDVISKFRECRRNTKLDRTSITYYFGCLKKYYGRDWISKVNEYEIPE